MRGTVLYSAFSRRLVIMALAMVMAIILWVAATALPGTMLFGTASAQTSSTAVSVPANQPWTDTGIDIPAGAQVDITASGRIRIAGSDPGKNPDGTTFDTETPSDSCGGLDVANPNAQCWSLIGRIGTGAPFSVGYGTSFTATTGGRLFLGVNDDIFGDNSGAWTADITVSDTSDTANNPTWATRSSMPTASWALGAATAADGKIYAVGGYDDGWVNENQAYDPATDTWTIRAPLPIAVSSVSPVAANNGKIYLIGGSSSAGPSATNQEYDPATDSWTTKTPMPTARWGAASVLGKDGKIYVIGGSVGDAGNVVGTVEAYDPSTDTWTCSVGATASGCSSTTLAPMPTAREDLSGATAPNGRIYAIGGSVDNRHPLSTVEEYDPTKNAWVSRSPMPTARWSLGSITANNGRIYAIAGLDASTGCCTHYATVEEYNPGTDTWSSGTNLPAEMNGPAVALGSNGKVYVMGGNLCCGAVNTNYEGTITPQSDTTPPAVNPPASVTVEATSSDGAMVEYDDATASDDKDGDVSATCRPASGTKFEMGTTEVTCSAKDAADNTGTASFNVTVQDTTAPTISGVPSDITKTAISASGAAVAYASPAATDAVDDSVTVSCTPASGRTFAVGTTTVTCSASDSRNNSASESFKVTITPYVPTSKEQCKKDGWKDFKDKTGKPLFKNQGDCVSFVQTNGKNKPG